MRALSMFGSTPVMKCTKRMQFCMPILIDLNLIDWADVVVVVRSSTTST